ncbi:DUF881 domain-containing protein [Luedemannella helvata]|uniref:DUF881 domain-containing protein n=2 Tax=Luedemannella helvata TaxID=349315 RepID=A0ABN2KAV0_9ACTN
MTGQGPRFQPDLLTEMFRNPLDPGYADAAERRASGPPKPAWRLAGARGLRLVVLVAIGLLLAVAYRHVVAGEPESARAHAGLVDEARGAQERTDELQAQADALRQEVAALRAQALGAGSGELRALREQEAATGLAKVVGDGVIVTVSDAPAQVDPTTGKQVTPEGGRVLDVDLQDVANGLWAAGAEAVAVNGQRLTATSTIRTAGGAILVDFRPVTSPYQVTAIGPENMLDSFLKGPSGAQLRGLKAKYGIQFSTSQRDDLTLPAAGTDVPLRYARPDVSPSPTPTGGGR